MSRCLLFAVLAPLLLAAAVDACSCAPPPPPKKALEQAAAVFSGKVLKVEEAGKFELAITFEVAGVWKGAEAKELVVRTGNNGAICGYNFEMGKSYLIYAHESTRDDVKHLVTGICTRTKLLDGADDELKEQGERKTIR